MKLVRLGLRCVAALVPLVAAACSGEDRVFVRGADGAANGGNEPEASAEGAADNGGGVEALGPAYLLMHTVQSPEGRQNYLYIEPSLDVGDLDPEAGREVSGASRSFVLGGKVYVADGENFIIRRYDVSADLQLVPSGEVSLANRGLSYFDTGWTFVDDDTAYYMNSEQQEVVIWDPTAMVITGSIDLSSLRDDRYPNFYADGGTKIGDKLYATYWNYDENGGPYDRAVDVAVIDTTTNSLVGVTRDDRCEMGWPGTALPNGDFYIVGNAAGIGYQFSDPPAKPNCVLRILNGETQFDPTFAQGLDEITAPLVGGATFSYANELQRAVTWSTDATAFADKEAWQLDSTWHPVLIDPSDWSAQVVEGVTATGWMGDTFVIDGAALFTVGTNGGSQVLSSNSALVRYEDGTLTELVGFSDWLQVVQRIR